MAQYTVSMTSRKKRHWHPDAQPNKKFGHHRLTALQQFGSFNEPKDMLTLNPLTWKIW